MSAVADSSEDQRQQADAAEAAELVVAESTVPVVRAGYANTALAIAPVISILVGMLAREAGAAPIVQVFAGVVVGSLVVLRYSRSISRIRMDDHAIQFMCALHVVRMRLSDLEYVRLGSIGGSMTASIETKEKGRLFSSSFHYISPGTNWGDVAHSQDRLQSLLEAKGVPIRAPRLLHRRIGAQAKRTSSM
jgi:hypothetical protein